MLQFLSVIYRPYICDFSEYKKIILPTQTLLNYQCKYEY